MKAALLSGIRTIQMQDRPEPKITRPTDVLLQIQTIGVCGSDMHYYRTGRIGDQVVQFPWLLGHECSATVLAVGEDVTRVKPGDRVAVDPLIWCDTCDQCLSGRIHTCRDQVFMGCPGQVDGCMTEKVVFPAKSLFLVPDGMSFEQAALVEPFSIGLYAQKLAGDVSGKTIGILGCGPIGLCVLAAVKAAGANKVYMTDILNYRCAVAGEMGADWAGNPKTADVIAEITAAQPTGLDVVFECAGEQDAVDNALDLAARGGKVMVVGIPETDRISFQMDTLRRHEITVQPVRRQNHCVQPAIDMIADGRVNLDAMVTHRFSLDQSPQAYAMVADYTDGVVKAMIHVPPRS